MDKISELIINSPTKNMAFCKSCNRFFIDDIKENILINCPLCNKKLKRGFRASNLENGNIYYKGKKVYWDRKKKEPTTKRS